MKKSTQRSSLVLAAAVAGILLASCPVPLAGQWPTRATLAAWSTSGSEASLRTVQGTRAVASSTMGAWDR